nr:hypothetical protein [Tanacetum cinerariifolium]
PQVTHTSSTALIGAVGVTKEFFMSLRDFQNGSCECLTCLREMQQFAEDRKNLMEKKKEEHSCLLLNRKFPPAAESRAS